MRDLHALRLAGAGLGASSRPSREPSSSAWCGVAWFALAEDGWERRAEQVLRNEGIPVERLRRGWPGELRGGDLTFILWEQSAHPAGGRRNAGDESARQGGA